MNYFNFKDALIRKNVVQNGYKYTVTVGGKDIAAGSVQGLIKVLNEIYKLPKTDILDEIFGNEFAENNVDPQSYSAKIKAIIDIQEKINNSPVTITSLQIYSGGVPNVITTVSRLPKQGKTEDTIMHIVAIVDGETMMDTTYEGLYSELVNSSKFKVYDLSEIFGAHDVYYVKNEDGNWELQQS